MPLPKTDDLPPVERASLEVSPPSPLVGSLTTEANSTSRGFSLDDNSQNEQQQGPMSPPPQQTAGGAGGSSSSVASRSIFAKPSNTTLLGTAFISFMTFSLVQLFFAFMAGSEAMKGDSAAMIVDSMTYLFNWVAERRKDRFDQEYVQDTSITDPARAERIRIRERRKLVLKLEIIPPLISVTTLIVVTIIILKSAIEVLILDITRKKSEQADPNIHLMMGFSVFNLGLDFLNVFCFARAKHLMGFATKEHDHAAFPSPSSTGTTASAAAADVAGKLSYIQIHQQEHHNGNECDCEDFEDEIMRANSEDSRDGTEEANLNMCSAYTHVFADTLRSIAVILAALLALLIEPVTSEEADSAAAIAVSILILLSLIPLFQGLYESACELRAIRAEELSENLFDETTEPSDGRPTIESDDANII